MENPAQSSPDESMLFEILVKLQGTDVKRNIEWKLGALVVSLKEHLINIMRLTNMDSDDVLNFGLFIPPSNGKNGKFLQEERILADYVTGNSANLEFRKKTRQYIQNSNSTKIKKSNSKNCQKQLVHYIKTGDIMKVTKLLNSGLDPNFHVPEIPETPLSLACRSKQPHLFIMALVNNGAYMDFRSVDSLTALHKTAIEGLVEPMETLLELGQSPNCKDSKGYTPLYYCIDNDSPKRCAELLLFEHSILGVCDEQGLQEIHRACLYGRTILLDVLLNYGADIDAKTYKGNTALHLCAQYNQESCARLLLYRGIARHAVNVENKNAYQTALLSNNVALADVIQKYKDEDIVPITMAPKFNAKRRSLVLSLKRFSSLGSVLSDSNSCDLDTLSIGTDRYSMFSSSGDLNDNKNNASMRNFNSADLLSLQEYTARTNGTTGKITSNNNRACISTSMWVDSEAEKQKGSQSNLISDKEMIIKNVTVTKNEHGFGFVMKGIGSADGLTRTKNPSTQYFERIASNTPSSKAGLKKGDFVLEVNGIDIHNMLHDDAVMVIKKAGSVLHLKIARMTDEYKTSNDEITTSVIPKAALIPKPLLDTNDMKKKNNFKIKTDEEHTMIKGNKKQQAPSPPIRSEITALTINASSASSRSNSPRNTESPLSITYSCNAEEKTKMKPIIPPPDYHSDSDSDSRLSKCSQSTHSSTFVVPKVKPLAPIPPETVSSSKSSSIVSPERDYSPTRPVNQSQLQHTSGQLPKAPPAPPPPAPGIKPPVGCASPPIFTRPKANNISDFALQSVVLNAIPTPSNDSTRSESPSVKDDDSHSAALRNAVLKHRQKVESGDVNVEQMDTILHDKKVGSATKVFEVHRSHDFSKEANVKSTNNVPVTKPKPKIPPSSPTTANEPINYKIKAEMLRSNIVKREVNERNNTLYFSKS